MADKKPKRPRDSNKLAKLIVDIATGEAQDSDPMRAKTPLLWRWADVAARKAVAPAQKSYQLSA